MKRTLTFFLTAAFIMIQTPLLAQTSRYVEEEEKPVVIEKKKLTCSGTDKPIRVAGFATNPPIGWVEQMADLKTNHGFALRFFEELFKDENLQITNRAYNSYQDAVNAVKIGKSDMLLGVYYEPKMVQEINFVYPSYLSNPFIVLFKKGKEKPVTKFEDLAGLKGVVRQEELIYPLIFDSLPSTVRMTQVSGARNAFKGLLDGTYDYMFTSLYAGEAEIRRFKLMDDIVITNTVLTQPELFFAFGKNSGCQNIRKKIVEKLRTFKTDKTAIHKMIIAQIDAWGAQFANDPSLPEMLAAEAGKSTQTPNADKNTNI